jgi:uncharacterized membrane protein (DUF106 family)
MEPLLIFLILVIVIGFLFYKLNYKKTKAPTVKKEEIIAQYKKELQQILTKYQNDKQKQLQEKKLFLQRCNSELSRNIFFSESEANNIIKNLAQL